MTKRKSSRSTRNKNSIIWDGVVVPLRPELEDGKLPQFSRNPIVPSFEEGHDENGCYQGWCNSATWCFHLYFMQYVDLYEKVKALYSSGKMSIRTLETLYRSSGIQIDDDCIGFVSVHELLHHYANEQALSEQQRTVV